MISKVKYARKQLTPKQSTEITLVWSNVVPIKIIPLSFFQGMLNRRIVGYYRHELSGINKSGEADMIKLLEAKLRKYKKTGNTELLMDIGNYASLEYMKPKHHKAHFEATDDGDADRYR